MKRITKIEENRALSIKKKTRVVAYCRVSTASDEQLISLLGAAIAISRIIIPAH